eukprot:COSAG01_NODE_108_length_25947_cov_25.489593_19_plen_127_part_00
MIPTLTLPAGTQDAMDVTSQPWHPGMLDDADRAVMLSSDEDEDGRAARRDALVAGFDTDGSDSTASSTIESHREGGDDDSASTQWCATPSIIDTPPIMRGGEEPQVTAVRIGAAARVLAQQREPWD